MPFRAIVAPSPARTRSRSTVPAGGPPEPAGTQAGRRAASRPACRVRQDLVCDTPTAQSCSGNRRCRTRLLAARRLPGCRAPGLWTGVSFWTTAFLCMLGLELNGWRSLSSTGPFVALRVARTACVRATMYPPPPPPAYRLAVDRCSRSSKICAHHPRFVERRTRSRHRAEGLPPGSIYSSSDDGIVAARALGMMPAYDPAVCRPHYKEALVLVMGKSRTRACCSAPLSHDDGKYGRVPRRKRCIVGCGGAAHRGTSSCLAVI